TSKAAVIHLTKTMATELWRYGIRVNALCPGYFPTEMNAAFLASERGREYVGRFPPRRLGSLHELTGPLLLLASDASSYMTGVALPVDGGHAIRLV
ncbi:MAG: SDR family oxidoreductase, partial [Rhodospirillaceae bacterium]|nr:SDR family oxidoreductase [Rhodospirillaceae bacterium]